MAGFKCIIEHGCRHSIARTSTCEVKERDLSRCKVYFSLDALASIT
jgi:hypothetical protein